MFASSQAASRLIIVSNRLPVTVMERDGALVLSRSTGGLATALNAVFKQTDALWIGWSGFHRQLNRREMNKLAFPAGILPVNLSGEQVRRYRERAFNETLSPLFLHHLPLNPCDEKDWQAVAQVMRRFATILRRTVKPDDVIWIHDVQLMFLPHYLREMGVTNRIGFFFHMPFPNISFLDQLPVASLLLDSLNQTDLLGFQTDKDALHFKESFRVLHPMMPIEPIVRAFPIGVDFDEYHQAAALPGVQAHMQELADSVGDKKVIFSMSRLDFAKGIVNQLHAVEHFLESQSPQKREQFVYTLVVAPSRENVLQNQHCKRDIETTVKRINGKLGTKTWQPVQYIYRTLGFEEVNAWYQLADTLLITPRLDGMNLVAKEYIAARHNQNGMLVLSKTIGAADQLSQSVLVDSENVLEIANGLRRAFALSPTERRQRWAALQANVREENIFWWTKSFVDALEHLAPKALPHQSLPQGFAIVKT